VIEILRTQGSDPAFTALSFEKWLGRLFDAEWPARRNKS
jgi:hypothetical protein